MVLGHGLSNSSTDKTQTAVAYSLFQALANRTKKKRKKNNNRSAHARPKVRLEATECTKLIQRNKEEK
jgi:hypothetical protein